MTDSEVASVHSRLDDLFSQLAELTGDVKELKQRCGPCSRMIEGHETLLRGNGRNGLVVEMARLKQGRVDTLTVKSVCALVGAIGALVATVIGAAMVH